MIEMIEIFQGEYGKTIMLGFIMGCPTGYAFARKTQLIVANDIISKKDQEIERLQNLVDGYVEQLIQKK